ncbi:MAG: diacylglycerol kinase family lipid kinase [Bacteroidetes bacterium]|nr:diacylglycerol kinase family lipid kinase [Bacteroidota bacterium]MBS1630140.1 diacylglycerol kinase family lipid kinase [Bacteroidota bacterium]
MKLCFIINPRAGTEGVSAIQAAIDKGINAQLHTVMLQYTTHAGHGTELARAAVAAGCEVVVAVGGDGSVRDVAKGVLGMDCALGILPRGSGNGLARSLGIPLKTDEALQRINSGNLRRIDVGFANDELFLSNAGVGFDALIASAFSQSKRRGLKAYSWLVAKNLWQFRAPVWQLRAHGKTWEEQAFIINVANGNQLGYNFKIAPQARPDDGWLVLTIIKKFPKALGGGIAWRAFRGNMQGSRYVQHLRIQELVISHPELKLMQTDGDAHPCSNKLSIRVSAQALNIIC